MRRLVLLLLPAICAHAAVPRELQALADQARALPPEFAADILLKIAASPLATDAKWKRELTDDAFVLGGHAQAPYRMRGNPHVDVAAVRNSRIDRLSLQTRAVEAMLPTDPKRALVSFGDIPAPALPKLRCEVALSPDLQEYYLTAASLFSSAFTPEERRKEADLAFLRAQLGAVHSPSQVVPALKMLDQVELSTPVRNELMAMFAGILERINGGDREFSASETLLVGAAVPEMHETSSFLPALRDYIVRHLSGPRCSDQMTRDRLPESATQFNALLSRIPAAGRQVLPITEDEVTPLKVDGTYPLSTAGKSEHARQIQAETAALKNENPATQQWTIHYFEVLKLLDGWKADDEASVDDYSLLVSIYYPPLLETAPSGPARKTVFGAFQHFVERQFGAVSNQLWSMEFSMLQEARWAFDKPWLLEQLLHSTNPVIVAYAQLEKLTGAS